MFSLFKKKTRLCEWKKHSWPDSCIYKLIRSRVQGDFDIFFTKMQIVFRHDSHYAVSVSKSGTLGSERHQACLLLAWLQMKACVLCVWHRCNNKIFQQDPQPKDKSSHAAVSHSAPPVGPKLQRSRKESQEPMITADRCHVNRRS